MESNEEFLNTLYQRGTVTTIEAHEAYRDAFLGTAKAPPKLNNYLHKGKTGNNARIRRLAKKREKLI